MTTSRRLILSTTVSLIAASLVGCTAAPPAASASTTAHGGAAQGASSTTTAQAGSASDHAASDRAFAALEAKYSADLGVSAVDTRTGRTVDFGGSTRFAFASTYKALAAGVLLRRDSDSQLEATIHYTAADLVDYSPITSQHVDTGMTLHDVIAAALQYSDNTAANLMLDQLGGPSGLQKALRGLGDTTTNVDHDEPDVNTATPGDPDDTTTPDQIGHDLRMFALGHWLTPSRRAELTDLMRGNTTGGPYIRAGVPAGWTVADKTGNGGYGTRNDVAVAWRPDGDPVVISILTKRHTADATSDDALIADATREVVAALR